MKFEVSTFCTMCLSIHQFNTNRYFSKFVFFVVIALASIGILPLNFTGRSLKYPVFLAMRRESMVRRFSEKHQWKCSFLNYQ